MMKLIGSRMSLSAFKETIMDLIGPLLLLVTVVCGYVFLLMPSEEANKYNSNFSVKEAYILALEKEVFPKPVAIEIEKLIKSKERVDFDVTKDVVNIVIKHCGREDLIPETTQALSGNWIYKLVRLALKPFDLGRSRRETLNIIVLKRYIELSHSCNFPKPPISEKEKFEQYLESYQSKLK